ncbi:MAG: aspartate-semialdehyde dehydrogenase, partial [Desulfosarcina sp.]|nr:aspartate-semialdehyde dehydrogenase [Desulfobacterales bacterium]
MLKVGIVGWRGMVGSVLMERMRAEDDVNDLEPVVFSTSQAGRKGPDIGRDTPAVADAYDEKLLGDQDIIVSCQGGGYTEKIYPALRTGNWTGYWIDAASTLRMTEDSVIVLDPVNRTVIDQALEKSTKAYIGGNCTVSLMLMALGGLFEADLIEWMTSMTYQASSGAGAQNMRELVAQMQSIGNDAAGLLADPATAILNLDRQVTASLRGDTLPVDH